MIRVTLLFLLLVNLANARIQDWPRAGEIRYRPSYQISNRSIKKLHNKHTVSDEKEANDPQSLKNKDGAFSLSQLRPSWLESGTISFRPSYQISRQPITDPLGIFYDDTQFHGRLYGIFKLEKSLSDFRFISQLRPRLDYTDNEINLNVGVDEAYIDYSVTPAFFIGLGKRNIFTGVGLGTNTTDYFGENKAVDTTLDEASRRDQRKGDYMLSIDWFFDNSSLSLNYAPRLGTLQKEQSRLLLSYNYFFESFNGDVSSYFFIGERPGIGLNMSKSVNDNLIVYSELSLRKGRNKGFTNFTDDGDNDLYSDALVGLNYAFTNGLNIYSEYWHKSSGYDDSEWEHIRRETITGIDALYREPNFSLGLNQLGSVNLGLTPRFLRKNYLFNRLGYSITEFLDISLVHILNLDDRSQFIRALIENEFLGKYGVGFQVEQTIGNDYEEFGIRPSSTNFTLYFKAFF